jgi:hypothetical protein
VRSTTRAGKTIFQIGDAPSGWQGRRQSAAADHTTVNEVPVAEALDDLELQWGKRYPGIVRLWPDAWERFTSSATAAAGPADQILDTGADPRDPEQRSAPDRKVIALLPEGMHPTD